MMPPGFVHDPFLEGGIRDIPPRPISSASPPAVRLLIIRRMKAIASSHGLKVLLAFVRIIAFFEIFKVDLRSIPWVVGAKRHFSAAVARVRF